MLQRINELVAHYEYLGSQLADPEVLADHRKIREISQERSGLEAIVDNYHRLMSVQAALDDARLMLRDEDEDVREFARSEIETLEPDYTEIEYQLKLSLLPQDPSDSKDVIMEIRAGAGGDEAGLFAHDLYRMYQRYAERHRWQLSVLNTSANDAGGFREITFELAGEGVYSRLKYESGVHRVQRVPVTESQGRIHTSAASVAVLPEAEEVDVHIDESDLRIDVFRSSGPGGQSVNTTDSAVRITHVPTGIVVTQQDERSQHKNKAKAMQVLRARLYEAERERTQNEQAGARKAMVGSGDRSERIRTYNFPQGRVTDHRINLTLHRLPEILEGPGLSEVIDALTAEDEAARLAQLDGVS